MFGLFAFFYVLLHFSVYLLLDQNGQLGALWQDIVKRPYITIGMLGLLLLIPLALTSTAKAQRRLGKALDTIASPDLRDRDSRRVAFLVAGQEGHSRAAAVRLPASRCCSDIACGKRRQSLARVSGARFARTDGA